MTYLECAEALFAGKVLLITALKNKHWRAANSFYGDREKFPLSGSVKGQLHRMWFCLLVAAAEGELE